jgi:hypothetical protein
VPFARELDALLDPPVSSNDPMSIQCDVCPRDAKHFYKSRPRNQAQSAEYHAFCTQHDNPDRGLASNEGVITLEQYVCEYIHES